MDYARIELIGRITQDIELKSTKTGMPVVGFALAVNKKVNGEKVASFFPCKAFDKTAKMISEHFGKGSAIMIIGEPSIDKWQDEQGKWQSKFEIVIREVVFVGGKDETEKKPKFEELPPQDDLPF